jgi:hypothetical protein
MGIDTPMASFAPNVGIEMLLDVIFTVVSGISLQLQ